MSQISANPAPAPASTGEALAMLTSAARYLAAADPAAMPAAVQAEALQVLEQAGAAGVAARASILAGEVLPGFRTGIQ